MQISDLLSFHHFLGQAFYMLLLLSFLSAPMGCFVVWRKFAYFGATLSHSSIIGGVIGVITGIGIIWGVLGFTLLLGVSLNIWLMQKKVSHDAILGMVAHFCLAIGIILVSSLDYIRIDLTTYLFGDVLATDSQTLIITTVLCAIGLLIITSHWKNFINLCITPDIAQVEGSGMNYANILFTALLSLIISLGIISVGALLIIAMLIIPAACGRFLSHSIWGMVGFTWIISLFSIILGLFSSYYLNAPVGPNIVVIMGMCFIVINGYFWLSKKI